MVVPRKASKESDLLSIPTSNYLLISITVLLSLAFVNFVYQLIIYESEHILLKKKERKNYSGKFQDLSEKLCLNHFKPPYRTDNKQILPWHVNICLNNDTSIHKLTLRLVNSFLTHVIGFNFIQTISF